MHSHLATVYRPDFGLLTDLYQLTMAYGYFKQGLHRRRSIFHLFYRTPPFDGQFAIAAGLPLALDLIERLKFSADDVQYLGRLRGNDGQSLFNEPFLNYLQRLKFDGDVWAIPEGEIVFPHEPLLRLEGNLLDVQLLETALLTVMNFSTLVTTKAARIKAAAAGDPVLEFGLRRAQGIDGGLTASRSAYLGGCDGTSNVWAGRYYSIPVKGTHAHSWVMVFPDELTAFEAYAAALPNNSTLLVDTYNTIEGTKNAIRVGKQLAERGHQLLGIRLDSGDLAELSKAARSLLDEAGMHDVNIVASNDLDEYRIKELKEQGAKINVWGIGTRLATSFDQPALGGVYKLASIQNESGQWEPRIKLSEQAIKTSNPGKLQVRRYFNTNGQPQYSQLYDEFQGEPEGGIVTPSGPQTILQAGISHHDLLIPVVQNGKTVYQSPALVESRKRAKQNFDLYSQGNWEDRFGSSLELDAQKRTLMSRSLK